MRRVLLLLLVAACEKNDPLFCQQNPGASGCPMADGNNTVTDAMVDGDPGIDARLTYGTGEYAVKLSAMPTSPLTLGAAINTTSNTNPCSSTTDWVSTNQPSACFVVATDITVSAALQVTGSRPLVLVATGTVKIGALVDVASHIVGDKSGPAANDSGCGTGTAPVTDTSGGGGGAGGSFMTSGGAGGKGDTNLTAGGVAAAALTTAPTKLRGGCPGQQGAAGGTGGGGGNGGGAIYVLGGTSIDLRAGIINASGSGGLAASTKGGGGGGGSGGMIVLSAPTISTDSATRLVANGGGGSSGAQGSSVGGEPGTSAPNTAAPGGSPNGGCGNENGGGSGFAGTNQAVSGSSVTADQCGGGGGGGGAGYITTNVALGSGVFSPAPVVQ